MFQPRVDHFGRKQACASVFFVWADGNLMTYQKTPDPTTKKPFHMRRVLRERSRALKSSILDIERLLFVQEESADFFMCLDVNI